MKNVLVLMTALLPTTGHADLIQFALNLAFSEPHKTIVVIQGRSQEPTTSDWRKHTLRSEPGFYEAEQEGYLRFVTQDDETAPQNPEDHPDFWNWWKTSIEASTGTTFDYVVASEPYGTPLAQAMGAMFIPYDIPRTLNAARGTDVRQNPAENWDDLLEGSKALLQRTVTLFGQESVGKSTLAAAFADTPCNWGYSEWVPEYARPYLETVGAELTREKMEIIWAGQGALQTTRGLRYPVVVQDTDLYSTVGYWSIGGFGDTPRELLRDANWGVSSRYYVLPDDVPFVRDPLRYGGDVRESTTQFWVDLLHKHLPVENHHRIVLVPEGTLASKFTFIKNDIKKMLEEDWKFITDFQRD